MGIGIFLTALFEVFRLNDCFFVKKDEGSTIGGLLLLPIAQSVHTVWDQSQTDGSIKSQSAAAMAAKKRFLQIRSDALLRLFVSRQVDPASHQSTNHRGRTHISKSDLGANGDGGIPLAGFQPFPTSPFPRSRTPDLRSLLSKSSWERTTTTRRTRQSREGGSNLVAFGDKA